jgi:hypothetical protein
MGACLLAAVLAAAPLGAAPAGPREEPGATLWRIDGSNAAVFVLGSIHMLRSNDYPLAGSVDRAYAAATSLVFEIDLDVMDRPETERAIRAMALLPEGRRLADELRPRTYERARRAASGLGLTLEGLQPLKPWFFLMTLTVAELEKLGFSADDGVDMRIYARARADGKPVEGLETLEEQLGMLDRLSAEDPDALVNQALDEIANSESEMAAIVAAWKRGDLSALERALTKSLRDYPEVRKTLLTDRNHRWAERIDGMLREGGTRLVVVGAMHLPGDEGLLELLRKRGWSMREAE